MAVIAQPPRPPAGGSGLPVPQRKPAKAGSKARIRERPKTRPSRNAKALKAGKTGLGPGGQEKPSKGLIKRKVPPRVLLTRLLSPAITLELALRGKGAREGDKVEIPCIMTVVLMRCTAMGEDEKTWEAQASAMRPRV